MNKVTTNPDYKGERNTIGERIGYIRRIRNMKQEDLAKKLGVKRNTLSQYEQDKRTVPLDIIIKISELLKVPTDYLLGRNEIEEYNADNQLIGNTIGLSNKAIEILKEMKKHNNSQLKTIDFLIRQEELFPINSIAIDKPNNISQEELEKLEEEALEKLEQEEQKWSDKHSTIISALDNYFNILLDNEDLFVTRNSIKKEKDFNSQLQKVLHTKKKINIKKIIDNALLSDVNTEIRKAKRYIERRQQNKK